MIELTNGLTLANKDFVLVLSHKDPARVVVSVPHDGLIANDLAGLMEPRKTGIRGRDKYVWPVVKDLVLCGLEYEIRIAAVRLLMPRTYLDGNRAPYAWENLDSKTPYEIAFSDKRLEEIHRQFHTSLEQMLRRSIKAYGTEVLFIDMHGFGRKARTFIQGYDLILGTANRKTISHGDVDIRFAEHMEARGYRVFLPKEKSQYPGGDPFDAGQNTRRYERTFNINAMQVEIHPRFRERGNEIEGKKLASDMAQFFVPR